MFETISPPKSVAQSRAPVSADTDSTRASDSLIYMFELSEAIPDSFKPEVLYSQHFLMGSGVAEGSPDWETFEAITELVTRLGKSTRQQNFISPDRFIYTLNVKITIVRRTNKGFY